MLPFTQALSSRRTKGWLSGSALDEYSDIYVRSLMDRGYLRGTISLYLSSLAHFAHWCARHHIPFSKISDATVDRFVARHLPSCQCAIRCLRQRITVVAALAQLIWCLRRDGYIPLRAPSVPPHLACELRDFEVHLKQVRGIAELTRDCYLRNVRRILSQLFGDRAIQIDVLSAKDISRTVQRATAGYKPASIKAVNNALRSYFAFKAIGGERTAHLSAALPRVALWRLSQLPKMISPQDIDRLLRTYDRTTSTGRRDYAIARCLIDLGLRRTEVARLKLDDIDWRDGVLRFTAKGQRVDVLPLPDATGRAIVDYLRNGRPQTTRRELFVRHRPPHNGAASLDLIRGAIRSAAKRCGLQDRIRGTHILRHTVAARLVQSGAPLKQIADLLRHRDIDTTTIYAKVDLPALTRVALPWPGSQA